MVFLLGTHGVFPDRVLWGQVLSRVQTRWFWAAGVAGHFGLDRQLRLVGIEQVVAVELERLRANE
jgi:hypothetical protein